MGEEAREEDAMFGKEEKTTRGAVERGDNNRREECRLLNCGTYPGWAAALTKAGIEPPRMESLKPVSQELIFAIQQQVRVLRKAVLQEEPWATVLAEQLGAIVRDGQYS